MRRAAFALLLVACSKKTAAPPTACVADHMDHLVLTTSLPNCRLNESGCRSACATGDGVSCTSVAYLLQEDGKVAAANELYERGCSLQVSNACVNVGARIWAETHTDEQLGCARRIFEKACDVNDAMGCAMVGRLMAEQSSTTSHEDARRYFEARCDAMKGPPCRMLAYYYEQDMFGPYEPERLKELMQRACDGHDEVACQPWKRVSDVFNPQ